MALCVLAGGGGRRLGGQDKAALDLGDGRPLLARVLARLAPWPGPRLVSGHDAAHLERLRALLPASAAPPPLWVADALTEADGGRAGPLAGLLAGLEAAAALAPSPPSWLLTVPVDVPFVPADLLAGLWSGHGREEGADRPAGCCVVWRGRVQPLLALWPLAVAPSLRRALGAGDPGTGAPLRRAGRWAALCGLRPLPWPEAPDDLGDGPFLNLNDAAALAEARRRVALERAAPSRGAARLFP